VLIVGDCIMPQRWVCIDDINYLVPKYIVRVHNGWQIRRNDIKKGYFGDYSHGSIKNSLSNAIKALVDYLKGTVKSLAHNRNNSSSVFHAFGAHGISITWYRDNKSGKARWRCAGQVYNPPAKRSFRVSIGTEGLITESSVKSAIKEMLAIQRYISNELNAGRVVQKMSDIPEEVIANAKRIRKLPHITKKTLYELLSQLSENETQSLPKVV
jgi:hypothetical protein